MPSIMLYVLCACPLDVGIVYVFLCSVFPLNVEGYIMNTLFVVIVILLTSNSAQLHCVSLGRACAVLPPIL